MLVGLQGGRSDGGSPSAGAVLEEYAEARAADLAADDRAGIDAVVEIVAAFFRGENADLVPGLRRTLREPFSDEQWLISVVPPRLIVPALASCVRLFSYYCVVSADLVELFPRELRRLSNWCRERGHATGEQQAAFESAARAASKPLREHLRLQRALEGEMLPIASHLYTGTVQGRFRIEDAGRRRVRVIVPGESASYRFPVPEAVAGLFEKGCIVSLVLGERAMGWFPVAASLPVDDKALDREVDRVRASPHGAWPQKS